MRRRDKEDGYTLVIIAAVLVVFLGFTALSVDVGVLYSARASAQRAADAAALAGALVFITRNDLTETTTPKQSDLIKAQAVSTAATNKMLGAPVTITATDVIVDTALRRVTVNVTQSQPTLFARILGENSANIHATAVAEAARNATGDRCPAPWFIPNFAMSTLTGCEACTSTPKQLLIDPAQPDQPTAWALALIGSQFAIKQQDAQNTIAPGQFYAIELDPSCSGADCYRESISHCPDNPITCNRSYWTKQGNMPGPTKQGVCARICYNGDEHCGNNCPQDTFVSLGRYRRPSPPDSDGLIGTTSRSLVTSPIVNMCQFCPDSFPNGPTQLTVIGFATVFIEGVDSGQGQPVIARLINITACAGGGGLPIDETGAFSLPIRLVRVP